MTTLTLRGVKGSPLTHQELDDNFIKFDDALTSGVYEDGLAVSGGDLNVDKGNINVEVGDLNLYGGDIKYYQSLAFHDLDLGADIVVIDDSGALLIGTDHNGTESQLRVSREGNQLVEIGSQSSANGQSTFVQIGNAGVTNSRSAGIKSTQMSSNFEDWRLSLVAYDTSIGSFVSAIDIQPNGEVNVNTPLKIDEGVSVDGGISIVSGDLVINGGGNVVINGGELVDGDGNNIGGGGDGNTDGSVTSIDVAAPLGFLSTGGPVTSEGTIELRYASSHSFGLPSNQTQGTWNTAYDWGDHSTQGYLGPNPNDASTYGRRGAGWVPVEDTKYTAGVGLSLSGTEMRMSGSYEGTFTATGDIVAYSDISLKENINPILGALDKVSALNGITFNRVGDKRISTGLSAQDVKAVLPEAVHIDKNGIHGVAYGNIVGLLVEAIKELKDEVARLKG